MTRTHTVYFSEDSLADIRAAYSELKQDFEDRKPYIDDETRQRMQGRLAIIGHAIDLLAEPVAE